ncbi:MAG: TVP38/TMEM64 family protein [Alicyclobacillaceae bacterium]|nr:TVP38/TMEM64 family protein [Alicyclobacillaceae bacterium]
MRIWIGSLWSVCLVLSGFAAMALFLYMDRNNQLSSVISGWGAVGIAASILLMAVLCMVPVPTEFLLLMNMRVYGVWAGVSFAWCGAMLGTLAVFGLARRFGRRFVQRWVSDDRFRQVESWVRRRQTVGLLFARLLPIPAVIVNYAAGLLTPVKLWTYMWTAAVTIIPYYIGTALLYLGIIRHLSLWLFVGVLSMAVLWLVSHWVTRRFRDRS